MDCGYADAQVLVLDQAAAAKQQPSSPQPPKEAPSASPCPHASAFDLVGLDVIVLARGSGQTVAPLLSPRDATVPFNGGVLEVDSELFVGTAQLALRGLPNTPAHVFAGRRRTMQWTLQGRFKQAVPLDGLTLGADFARALALPAGGALMSRAASWLVAKMGGGAQLELGAQPRIAAPLIAAAQVVHVARPGAEPDVRVPGVEVQEDLTAWDPTLVGGWSGAPLTAAKRRAHFARPAARAGRCFSIQHVYTFVIYEHLMSWSEFKLELPLLKFDLVQVLDGQPMRLMLQHASAAPGSRNMLQLEVWHRRMLQHNANANAQPTVASDEP